MMKTAKLTTINLLSRTALVAALFLINLSCAGAQSPTPAPNTNRPGLETLPSVQGPKYSRPDDSKQAPIAKRTDGGDFFVASPALGREMPYRVIVPDEYKTNTAKSFPVIYLLHGLTGHYNDWGDRSKIRQLAAKGRFIIVMPEGNDGWYTDSRTTRENYQRYIIQDLIPEINRQFRTRNTRDQTAIAGLSMGGYGALKFGISHQRDFALVGSFSGAFVTNRWSEKVGGNKLIGKSLDQVFGPLDNNVDRRSNDIFKIAEIGNPASWPYIYLSCGTEDLFIKVNQEFKDFLVKRGLQEGTDFEAHFTKGGHSWPYWGEQIVKFLEVANARIPE